MRLNFSRVALVASAILGAASCSPAPRASSAGAVVARDATAQSCPTKLSPQASLIYQGAALDMRSDTDMPTLLREKVIALVFTDRLAASEARPAAEQAATCLEELRTRR